MRLVTLPSADRRIEVGFVEQCFRAQIFYTLPRVVIVPDGNRQDATGVVKQMLFHLSRRERVLVGHEEVKQ
jgi:hypothetical protein